MLMFMHQLLGWDIIAVLNVLCDTIRTCSDEYLFLGGDFNCTENPRLDRNPASSRRFRQLTGAHEL